MGCIFCRFSFNLYLKHFFFYILSVCHLCACLCVCVCVCVCCRVQQTFQLATWPANTSNFNCNYNFDYTTTTTTTNKITIASARTNMSATASTSLMQVRLQLTYNYKLPQLPDTSVVISFVAMHVNCIYVLIAPRARRLDSLNMSKKIC